MWRKPFSYCDLLTILKMLNLKYNWSRFSQIYIIILICSHTVCCSRLHTPQWSKALLAVTWSFLLSRHLPPSSFPHPVQPWHSYIIAFGKLCDTPPTSSSTRRSPISHRTHLLCLRQRRQDSQTDLSQSVLLPRCRTHSYFYLFRQKKRKKSLPIKDWICRPSFQWWEIPDKVTRL